MARTYTFDHIHLRSLDPLKTLEFYEKRFGAKRISFKDDKDGRASAKLEISGVTILVSQVSPGSQTGLVHFGIRTENLEKSVKEMKAAGVPFTQEPLAGFALTSKCPSSPRRMANQLSFRKASSSISALIG